jgi:hypothetical protein
MLQKVFSINLLKFVWLIAAIEPTVILNKPDIIKIFDIKSW